MTKYGAKITKCLAGHTHASKKEALRCNDLMMLSRAGQIQNLQIQPPAFKLWVNGQVIESYRPDATYYENGELVVEDTKGKITRDYRRKKKWMRVLYQVEIRET